jgi:hypothetical protein
MIDRLFIRGLRRRPAWALVVLLLLAGANLSGQLNRIASVAYVEGQVEVLRYGSEAPMPAEIGMTLLPGDQIKTRKGKCQLNFTTSGILRLSPDTIVLFPTRDENFDKSSQVLKMLVGKTAKNFRQVAGLDPDSVFDVRQPWESATYVPAPPDVVAQRAKEDAERLAAQRPKAPAPQSSGTSEEQAVAEYRSLLPAVVQAERKAWHTRFEFLANAVKTGAGYRVAYKTYCLIDKGPDTGKDYVCFELDTVLDIGAVRSAVADMKRRLGR